MAGSWVRAASLVAMLATSSATMTGCGPGTEPQQEPQPAVTLARVHSAPLRSWTPGVTLTVTAQHVDLDATAVLLRPRGEVPPGVRGRSRLDLRQVVGADEESDLRVQLEHLLALDRSTVADDSRVNVPQLRLRVAAELRFGDLVEVLRQAARAGHGALEFEVATERGVGHLNLRPYTFCACPMPADPSWCAAPTLRIERSGVTLIATPDLTPPPGCHKAIPRMGQSRPAFAAAVDWRNKAIAGPQGGCPSAQVGDTGLDVVALSDRLRALHAAAPGCGWASMAIDDEAPWSIVAPAMAALFAEFGELRVSFSGHDDPASPVRVRECQQPLPVTALSPGLAPSPEIAAPPARFGRPGCVD